MAVPEQIPVVNYVADGIVKKFDVPFEYDQQSDLHIYVDGAEPTIDKYYFDGNAFNFYIAPTNGQGVKIKRITPKERDTDYNLHTNTVRPKALNTDFDRLWYVLQEVFSDVGGLSQAVQDEIIARIQGDEDLLNQLTAEISARMLGDEAVTEDLKNYVDQVVGAIINDPDFDGIDADKVNDASGETQQQVNYNGGSKWHSRIGGYKLNERVVLTNGDIVKSTIDGNTNDPNVDMTGWDNRSRAINVLVNLHNPLNLLRSELDVSSNFAESLNSVIDDVSSSQNGGTIHVPSGNFNVDTSVGINLKSNVKIVMQPDTVLTAIPTRTAANNIFNVIDCSNVSLVGGVVDGNRDNMLAPDNNPYLQFKNNTAYTVGQYVWIQRWGCIVTSSGTSTTRPPVTIVPTIGTTLTSGSVSFECVEDVGEWGFGVSIRGSTNVVNGIREIRNMWGDGVYIGSTASQPYCENVVMATQSIDNCRRQGVSVISVKGLYWNTIGSTISNTNGTSPEAGIDLEPNNLNEFMTGVDIANLTISNCAGNGFHVYLGAFASATSQLGRRFDATLRSIRSVDNAVSGLSVSSLYNEFVTGVANIYDSWFGEETLNSKTNPAMLFDANNPNCVQWNIFNTTFQRNSSAGQALVRNNLTAGVLQGGIHFYNCSFVQKGLLYDAAVMCNNALPSITYRDISIVNPLRIDFLNQVLRLNRASSNIVLTDSHGVFYITLAANRAYSSGTFLSVDLNGYTYTVPAGLEGCEFKVFSKVSGSRLTFTGALIGYPDGYSFNIPAGGYIVAKMRASAWEITEMSPLVNKFYSITNTIPSQLIASGGTLILTYSYHNAVTGGVYTASFNKPLLSLGIVSDVRCNASGTVDVELRNITSSGITISDTIVKVQRLDV